MKNKKGVLVLGASGLIGSALYHLLKQENRKVIGTYKENPKPGLVYFDLAESSLDDLSLKEISYAVICSAITKLDACKSNPEYSHLVNVSKTEEIIAELSKRGILPVFFSSGAVFDGREGGYKENSIRNPISLYGEQKVEVEDFIITNIKDYLIIRPGKVLDFKKIFSDWLEKYKNGGTIICANDEKLSFTHPDDVAKAIVLLLDKNSKGIYHLNPQTYCSRFELATKFFNKLGIKDVKIKPCSIDDFGTEKRAKNSFMNASKFIKETGFKFKDLEDYLMNYK